MHILMIGMDTALLTGQIGNSRARHEGYAAQVGRISMVVCNRRGPAPLPPYRTDRLEARPTESRSYAHYLLDGYRMAMRVHAEQPIDVITTQDAFLTGLIGLAVRRRIKAPLIMQDHSCVVENPYFAAERPINRGLQWLARQTLRRADAVRVVNHEEGRACQRIGIPADRVCCIPVAPELGRFIDPVPPEQITAWRDRLGLAEGTPVALWVGRPVTFKNVPMLVRAFGLVKGVLPDARLVLAGDMRGTTIPEQIAALDLQDAISLPGPVPHADLPALCRIATVYAHSSNYEGFGLVLAEAAASGVPAVTTATDGAAETVVDGQSGLLVPVGDEQALANALIALLSDPARAAQMGAFARDHVRQTLDERQLADRWVGMWRAVAAGEPPCAS
jgi:glycosyltransferase involved in cell wall biosynthesis